MTRSQKPKQCFPADLCHYTVENFDVLKGVVTNYREGVGAGSGCYRTGRGVCVWGGGGTTRFSHAKGGGGGRNKFWTPDFHIL